MIKKYVRGNASNPEGVIKALENLGGINEYYLTGDEEDSVYYINNGSYIYYVSIGTDFADVITECFEEIQPIQPIESAPKVITNLDVSKWYFRMLREGHAVQFKDIHGYIRPMPLACIDDDVESGNKEARIDFGEWIPIEEAIISGFINISKK